MDLQPADHRKANSLREHLRQAWAEANVRRPISFYLLVAILVFVLIGSRFGYVREDPKRFTLFLILNFLFFFFVLMRATLDFFDIARSHFSERHHLFGRTLGDRDFVERLGQSAEENRNE
jgi:hypothetical protein